MSLRNYSADRFVAIALGFIKPAGMQEHFLRTEFRYALRASNARIFEYFSAGDLPYLNNPVRLAWRVAQPVVAGVVESDRYQADIVAGRVFSPEFEDDGVPTGFFSPYPNAY